MSGFHLPTLAFGGGCPGDSGTACELDGLALPLSLGNGLLWANLSDLQPQFPYLNTKAACLLWSTV